MPEELKGYKCPDKEDCSECEFHNTKCIVYSVAGRKKYELWKKQQADKHFKDKKES